MPTLLLTEEATLLEWLSCVQSLSFSPRCSSRTDFPLHLLIVLLRPLQLNNWNTASALYKSTFKISLGIVERTSHFALFPLHLSVTHFLRPLFLRHLNFPTSSIHPRCFLSLPSRLSRGLEHWVRISRSQRPTLGFLEMERRREEGRSSWTLGSHVWMCDWSRSWSSLVGSALCSVGESKSSFETSTRRA